jgi:twinkle protein
MQRDKGNGPYLVPTLYDMAGSAHFFNKSHNGISVYRHFFEDGTSSPEVFVQKVKFKHWGRQGSVALQYDIDSGRFYQPSNKQSGNYLEQKASQEEMPFEI